WLCNAASPPGRRLELVRPLFQCTFNFIVPPVWSLQQICNLLFPCKKGCIGNALDAKFRPIGFEDLVDGAGHVGAARLCVQLRTVVYGIDSRNWHMDLFVDCVAATEIPVSGFSWLFSQIESEERLAR